jgi:ATP-dependent HslUV protease ATP-binding subunit HslU
VALLATEGVSLRFTDGAIAEIARLATEMNERVENIGARRLHTVMERLVEEISFTASDRAGDVLEIDPGYVRDNVGHLLEGSDLTKFIL